MRKVHQILFEYCWKSLKQYIKKLINGKNDDDNHFQNPYVIL